MSTPISPAAYGSLGGASLPHGWSTGTTSYGRLYYVNHNTRSTTWERPAYPAAPVFVRNPSVGGGWSGVEASLPPGWSAGTTSYGRLYYVNHNTRSTTWERPAYPAAPAATLNSPAGGGWSGLEAPQPPANVRSGDAPRGLSRSELEMLPQQTGNGSGPVDQCSVCMEDMTSTETIVRLPGCMHTFHRDCIRDWLSHKACCPLDQTTVSVTG